MADRDETPALLDDLLRGLRETAERVAPWFNEQMPRRYFQDTSREDRLTHLAAITAARASGMPPRLTLTNADETEWTFIQERDYPGLLLELLGQLPHDRPLRSAKVHTTADDSLVLDVFSFGGGPERAAELDATFDDKLREAARLAGDEDREGGLRLAELVDHASKEYLAAVSAFRLYRTWQLCRRVAGTDETVVELEPEDDGVTWRISVAAGGARPRDTFERIVRQLSFHRLDIHRAYVDTFADTTERPVALISVVVRPLGNALVLSDPLWQRIHVDLMRVRWLDDRAIAMAHRHAALGLARAEVLVGLCQLIHPCLAAEHGHGYSTESILAVCERNFDLAQAIAGAFLDAFAPAPAPASADADATAIAERLDALEKHIDRDVDAAPARRVLKRMVLACRACQYTNAHVPARYGLAIRFDPAALGMPQPASAPYAAVFVHARDMTGFHVRFRDIARGGVRVVRPVGPEQHALEAEHLWTEVYDLAFAQQLKNKDIPEGGAKAVVLVEPGAPIDRALKSFANSLLDLIAPDPATAPAVRGAVGERLYLGPDENVTPAMITWIVERARSRSYPTPDAFMSSKPGAGINHKEYGVTSEGVTVFLDEALRAVGIDPDRQSFTVKITGGPDGDVAGNELKILARDYGARARVVGIADGSGCAEDPDGLDSEELARLVAASAPIADFDREKLGSRGRVLAVTEPGGVKARNTLHNRVIADAFVPAGGRPETINGRNWRAFLTADGTPSARVIVEGANLFLTAEARERLATEAGVLIVKDSSANKCGVICSSLEIGACMLLEPDEFIAVKPAFVEQVLRRLRQLARAEARLLFRERRWAPDTPLPALSVRISEEINRATDAIEAGEARASEEDRARFAALVRRSLPPALLDAAGDRLDRLRPQYLSRLTATLLSTRIIYREGLAYLAELPSERVAELAFAYLRHDQRTEELITRVESSGLADRDEIARLLAIGGTRAALSESPPAPGPARDGARGDR